VVLPGGLFRSLALPIHDDFCGSFRDTAAQFPGSARVIPQACLRFGSSLVSVEEKNVYFPSSPFPAVAGARNRHYAPAVFRLRLKSKNKISPKLEFLNRGCSPGKVCCQSGPFG